MRLFLSSFRNSNRPDELLRLLGPGRRAAVISNAIDLGDAERRRVSLAEEMARLRAIGLEPSEVDLRDHVGNRRTLKETLAGFDLLWARGGNTFVLRRAMAMSGADSLIPELLAGDTVVYGGYSAGVCVLASTLRGLELCDDPESVPPGYDAAPIWEGLGLLPYCVVPHYRSDHPESEMMEDVVSYFVEHHEPFIALRDGQAIVIDKNDTRVMS